MNSFQELNNYSNTEFEYTDLRPAGVFFDRITPNNQSVSILEGQNHYVPWGIEITDIANYQTELPYVEFNITDLDNYNANFNMQFGTLLAHMTLTQITANKVWRITGLRSVGDWEYIKNTTLPRVISPSDVYGNFSYTVKVGGATTNKTWTVNLSIANVILLTTPSATTYDSGVLSALTGEPQINNPGYTGGYTITVQPVDYNTAVNAVTMSVSNNGGAFVEWNGINLLISGVEAQVNIALSAIRILVPDGTDYTFRLQYQATATTTGETDTVYQTLVSSDNSILGAVRGAETYVLNTQAAITNGPLITDSSYSGLGLYQMVIKPNDANALGSLDITVPTGTFTATDELDLGIQSASNQPSRISISSDARTMAIGFPQDGSNYGPESDTDGVVKIFVKTLEQQWTISATLINELSQNTNLYGQCVQLSNDGDRLYVSASQDTNPSTAFDNIRDCIVTYTGNGSRTTWTQLGDLITAPSDGSGSYKPFGKFAVSRDESTIAVLCDGNNTADYVFIYYNDGSGWTLQTTLTHPYATNRIRGQVIDISTNGNTVVVGSPGDDNTNDSSGRVHVYKRTGISWSSATTITPDNSTTDAQAFGCSVSLSSDGLMLAVGAPLRTYSGGDKGEVIVYTRLPNGDFTQYSQIRPASSLTTFGSSVKLSADKLQLSIIHEGYQSNNSAIHIYTRTPNTNFSSSQILTHSFDARYAGEYTNTVNIGMSDDKSTIVAYGYVPGGTIAHFLESFTSNIGKFYDEANGELVVTGTKSAINIAIDTITYTPATGYTSNFDLLYECETPTNGQTIKNQTVTRIT